MRETVKNIPVLGKILTCVYYYMVIVWKYITHKLLRNQISTMRWNKMKREILRDFSSSEDADVKELTANIRKQNTIRTFNYPFVEKYASENLQVFWGQNIEGEGYPYVLHKMDDHTSRKIYFPKESSVEEIRKSYGQLLAEQDKDSPHCYSNDEFSVKADSVILDLGVAEGNFSIGLVDRAKHIYLFEGDPIWWKPLELTFEEWKDKVTIIRKYVSDIDDDQYISLGTFLEKKEFGNERLFIKMDIEGYEERVLHGCAGRLSEMLQSGSDLTMAVCAYHKQSSESDIRDILEEIGFGRIKPSKGFMILNNFNEDRIYPYIRRGLLFASDTKGTDC